MDSSTRSVTQAPDRLPERLATSERNDSGSQTVGAILVAVDMSMDSRAALLWAYEHAAIAGTPVTVLHAIHDQPAAPGTYSRHASDPFTPMSDTAEKMLAEFMTDLCADHPELERFDDTRMKVVVGLPAQTIVDEAMRLNAGLIVIGSRGQTGLPKLLYGSTAQRVVQLSPIPVTVVKAPVR